jgi:2-methylisocitrate lyase-like PEP mutase family enzyme
MTGQTRSGDMRRVAVNSDFEACAPVRHCSGRPADGDNLLDREVRWRCRQHREDSRRDTQKPLYDFALAVERIRAARAAIDATGSGVFLTARSEGFFVGRPDLAETIRRLRAYAEAGLYAPGLSEEGQIEDPWHGMTPCLDA